MNVLITLVQAFLIISAWENGTPLCYAALLFWRTCATLRRSIFLAILNGKISFLSSSFCSDQKKPQKTPTPKNSEKSMQVEMSSIFCCPWCISSCPRILGLRYNYLCRLRAIFFFFFSIVKIRLPFNAFRIPMMLVISHTWMYPIWNSFSYIIAI